MSYTIEEIRKNYEGFSNEKLMRIATEQAAHLTPEAVQVLKDELARRNLDNEALARAIETQAKQLSDEDLEVYIARIERLPCPICGATDKKLNLVSVFTVKSFVLFTRQEGRNVIACPDCLVATIEKANRTSFLLGWWAIPTGVLRTSRALLSNGQSKKRIQTRHPLLKEFVKLHLGVLELAKDNPDSLLQLVKENNEYRG
jgi:uncharacterized protein (UPF0212 family)